MDRGDTSKCGALYAAVSRALREGYLPSADFGAAFRTQFLGGYGEVFGGLYNGEGFGRADPNDQKAFEFRGTLRPLPAPGLIHGLRLTFSYDADPYQKGNDRARLVDFVSYEGQALAPELGFAAVPPEIVKLEMAALARVRVSWRETHPVAAPSSCV